MGTAASFYMDLKTAFLTSSQEFGFGKSGQMYEAEAFKSSFVGRRLSHLDEKPAKRRSGSRRVRCWLQVFEMPTYVQVIFLQKPEISKHRCVRRMNQLTINDALSSNSRDHGLQSWQQLLLRENPMRKNNIRITALAFAVLVVLYCSIRLQAQVEKAPYPAMAPLDQYLISDENVEIALARSAAPASISDAADVMVLRRDGYTTAVKGSNGFVCIVERSWATTTDDPQFWNPKIRAPHCFNSPAAKTFLPIFLMKTKLVLAGKSRAEIVATISSALETKGLPALAPGTAVYMMSKQQYLNDTGKSWHPHVMFYASGDAEKSWGANLAGSPIMAAYDPEQRVTTFFVLADEWSDGTPGPPIVH